MSSYSLKKLAEITKCSLVGDDAVVITGVASLEKATPADATFLANARYESQAATSKAGVIVIKADAARSTGQNYLLADSPEKTFQQLIDIFCPKLAFTGFTDIHPTAVIHPTAKIGKNVKIGPYSVIDQDTVVGDNCYIAPGVVIGPFVQMGTDCIIHSQVAVREGCKIGNRVVLQPGSVIGSCGYGFATDKLGHHTKLDQVGIVVIEDDVEVGANTTIDRARFDATVIGQGTKIDNLVQIAHNVLVGKHNLIVAQVAIGGSASIGNNVVLAGKVAVNGHIHITDQVMVAACSGVTKSLTEKGKYAGFPAIRLAEHNKNLVLVRNIDKYVEELKALKAEINSLQNVQQDAQQDAQ